MATTTISYKSSVRAFAGGNNSAAGRGATWRITVGGTPVANNELSLNLVANSNQSTLASGNVIGTAPVTCLTLANRVYFLSGSVLNFSSLADPTVFETQGVGAGFIDMSNQFSEAEPLTGLAPYQGKIAIFGRRSTQIWAIDADPANFSPTQVLPNIGTVAPLSVQAIGDMDVYVLADNGVRSVRVRDASNNAIIADVGTPIDAILQGVLATLTDDQKAQSCGTVEPSSNRYWLFVPNPADPDNGVGKIYVFSYFPSSQIAAWSTYSPSYQAAVAAPASNYAASIVTYTNLTVGVRYAWTAGAHEVNIVCGVDTLTKSGSFIASDTTAVVTGTGAAVTFTGALSATTYFKPVKFVVSSGQIFVLGADAAIYAYGGADTNTYENCGVSATTPYIDNGSPATRKAFSAVDAGFSGTWKVKASADYITQAFKTIYNNSKPSFQYGRIGYGAMGTHYALQMIEDGDGYAVFSSAIMHIDGQGDEK
jgi:hypothetical protein